MERKDWDKKKKRGRKSGEKSPILLSLKNFFVHFFFSQNLFDRMTDCQLLILIEHKSKFK